MTLALGMKPYLNIYICQRRSAERFPLNERDPVVGSRSGEEQKPTLIRTTHAAVYHKGIRNWQLNE